MTANRWWVLFLASACTATLCGCCCGTTTYTRSTYESGTSGSYTSDLGRAYLVVGSAHRTGSTGGMDSEDVYEPPYELDVGFDAPEPYDDPVRVLSAKLVHQGQTIVVHDRASPPLEDPLEYDEGRDKYVARIEFPLGDSLSFVDGSTLEATVVVAVPWEDREVTVERTFTGQFSESSGTIWDAWMGI